MSISKIDIIIPVYNRAHLIMDTLKSIQCQSFKDWNCFLIDDGSEDNLEEVVGEFIQSDNRFHFFKRPPDRRKGANACRNFGFEKSTSPFVYWFDSDDLLKPNALETYIHAFHPSTDVVIAPVEKVELETGKFIENCSIVSDTIIADYFNYKICYFVCGPMWRRSFLNKQHELFDESLGHHDEWDFNLRMIYQNPSTIILEIPLVLYRQHNNSFKKEISKGNEAQIESAFKARFKHLNILTQLNPSNKKEFQKYIAHQYKKQTRNFLLTDSGGWLHYYRQGMLLYFKSNDFKSIIKVTFGVFSMKIFRKGYRFFD